MSTEAKKNSITARIFDFIDLSPTQIKHMSYSPESNRLYISRSTYSQIYTVFSQPKIQIQQICVLQPCQQIYQIDTLIVMVLGFELKIYRNSKWQIYPFTTQILPTATTLNKKTNKLYTFHVNQCCEWSISQDRVDVKYLNKNQIPYHVNAEGVLEGYGKRVKPNNIKQQKFTIAQLSGSGAHLFVGSSKGQLHVYETKYLTHVKTFHRHEGPILDILCEEDICYFTGSDSKVSSLINIHNQQTKGNQWVLSKQVRAQSHDVLSLAFVSFQNGPKYLVSGGITTDVCFYELTQQLTLTENWTHKISYTSHQQCLSIQNYVIVNKFKNFQIWKVSSPKNFTQNSDQQQDQNSQQSQMQQQYIDDKSCVQLLVKFQTVFYKSIKFIIGKKDQSTNSIILFVVTQQQATLYNFTQTEGLTKLLTVKNHYNLAKFYKKDGILTIREQNKLELFNYKTGSIKQISTLKLQFPTDLRVAEGQARILIGSKYSQQIEQYQIYEKPNNKKGIKCTKKLKVPKCYNILDHSYTNPNNLLIKYQNQNIIYEIDKNGQIIKQVVKIPVKKVRNYGWVNYRCSGKKDKIFWFCVSQSKIVIVSKMKKQGLNKKIRVKSMPRIANVVVNKQPGNWNFGVVKYDFSKMIQQQIMPIITKKIIQ